MPKQIIGLIGRKGSGKSTLANLLVRDYQFRRISFAAPLKGMLRAFLLSQGMSMDLATRLLEGDLKEASTPYFGNRTPRHAMQTLGTEWGRNLICPDLWLDAWSRAVGNAYTSIVTDDVRFLNEAQLIKDMGGTLVQIVHSFANYDSADEHLSETEFQDIVPTCIITNSAEPEYMVQQLQSLKII